MTSKDAEDTKNAGPPRMQITLLEALEEICDEAVDRHSVHAHGPGSVQCDSICELIPKMRAAIRKATEKPNGREG